MDKLLFAMDSFEKRNNVSIGVELFSDGSWSTNEFWEDDSIERGNNIESLIDFLNTAQFKLTDDGRCIRPMVRIDKKESKGG
ncbi:MAG: hypothetical protein QHC79_09385 [Pseudosphingobacterium sp.]|nr:hypothetical protein [Pseudosphingobacterium sp.]